MTTVIACSGVEHVTECIEERYNDVQKHMRILVQSSLLFGIDMAMLEALAAEGIEACCTPDIRVIDGECTRLGAEFHLMSPEQSDNYVGEVPKKVAPYGKKAKHFKGHKHYVRGK